MEIEGVLEARVRAFAMRDQTEAARRQANSMRKVARTQLLETDVLAEALAPHLRRASGRAPTRAPESSASRIESSERHIRDSVKLIALGVARASASRRPSSPF